MQPSRLSRSILCGLVLTGSAIAQVITTAAGTSFVYPSQPLAAVNAPLGSPIGVATDSKGNAYLTDYENNIVVRVSTDGMATVVAGNGTIGFSGDNGPATDAALHTPYAVALDTAGNIYIAEFGNNRVRKVSTDGIITTLAGNGAQSFSGDNGPATSAALQHPSGVTVDSAGNVYIADQFNNRIRKVSSSGIISTFAGNGTAGFSGDGGPAASAELNGPFGVAVDPTGNLYIADTGNQRIRKVSAGIITTVAQPQGPAGVLVTPTGIALDPAGNLYIADHYGLQLVKISGGSVTALTNNNTVGFSGDGGPVATAQFNGPYGVALDSAGNLFVADTGNFRIRKISNGNVTTVAGNGAYKFFGDGGTAISASLSTPQGVAVDSSGNLYIADTRNYRIRKVSAGGIITTIAGNGIVAFSGDGGPATAAALREPLDVAVDAAGNLYIADTGDGRIRKVSTSGIITTLAGTGTSGPVGDGGPAVNAPLIGPMAVALDTAGNLYIAEAEANRIRLVSTKGIITTFAGTGTADFSGDGGPAVSAALNGPSALAIDTTGNVYIADHGNNRIRRVSNGTITTIAGNGNAAFSFDGIPASGAALNKPDGLAIDVAGNLYISEAAGNRVRKISNGIITTFAGSGTFGSLGDGGPAATAQLENPGSLAADSAGNLYIADRGNDRIREVLNFSTSFQALPAALSFSGITGSVPPAPQQIRLLSKIAGLAFSVSTSAPWLSVTPSTGTMPGSLGVTADPSQLAVGNYTASITITAPDASPPSQTIPVSFAVSVANPPTLAAGATSLAFSFRQGANPGTQQLTVLNVGAGSIAFTATASTVTGGKWLSVAPAGGAGLVLGSPVSLTVTATPGSLAVGSYSGAITLASADTGQQITVPVTLVINSPPQNILLSQAGFSFTAVAQGGTVLPQSLGILNTGSGTLNYSIQTSTQPGPSGSSVPWLSVSQTSGTVVRPFLDVSFVDINVDARSLPAGAYYGQVTVSAPGASNSPQTAVVVLTVLPPGSNPGPDVRPTGLVFTGVVGDESPGSQTVTVANLTANPVTFGSNVIYPLASGWINNLPSNATVSPSTPVRIVVQPDFSTLNAGPNRAFLTLGFDDGSVENVSILAVLAPAGTPQGNSTGEIRRANSTCVATKLLPQFTQVGFGSSVTANSPAVVAVKVVDDCGMAQTDGSVQVSFDNGDAPISLVSLQDGNWTFSWQPGQAAPNVALTAKAQTPMQGMAGTAQAAATVQPGVANTPVLAGLPLGPFAPGDVMMLRGIQLADGQMSSSADPLPQQLAGVSVMVAGTQASLLYADAGQVLALVPPGAPVNTSSQLILQRDNALAVAAPATITAAHPAILTVDGSSQGQGLIYSARASPITLANTQNPARAGDTIIVYCTGLGTTDAKGNATNQPQLFIGGQAAQVTYAGVALSGSYPPSGPPTLLGGKVQVSLGGLYQISALVPAGLPDGPAAISVTSAGQASGAGVTLAVAGATGSVGTTISGINTAYGSADISQNDFIEIHGAGLAATTAGPATLTPQLGGASVTVNGKPALLYYASPTQINALTPLDSSIGPVQVVLTTGGSSVSYTVNLRTVTPAFLRFGDVAHIAATHADGSLLGPGSLGSVFTPAQPGETIITYAVGFGLPSSSSSSPSQSGALPTLPICQIGSTPATVAFAGLNGFAGLYQLNLIVPATVSNGDNAVSCTYGGQTTPTGALLSVQR